MQLEIFQIVYWQAVDLLAYIDYYLKTVGKDWFDSGGALGFAEALSRTERLTVNRNKQLLTLYK